MDTQNFPNILIFLDWKIVTKYNETHCDENKFRTDIRLLIHVRMEGELLEFQNNSNSMAKDIVIDVQEAGLNVSMKTAILQ